MPASADPAHLFVYGTLRAGFPAHHLLAGRARAAGTGCIAGRLHDTGRYPAAVASRDPADRVRGELYLLPLDDGGALLAELDRYEGFLPADPERSLFRRVAADVDLADATRLPAWVYLFNHPLDGSARVPSGDYADCR